MCYEGMEKNASRRKLDDYWKAYVEEVREPRRSRMNPEPLVRVSWYYTRDDILEQIESGQALQPDGDEDHTARGMSSNHDRKHNQSNEDNSDGDRWGVSCSYIQSSR